MLKRRSQIIHCSDACWSLLRSNHRVQPDCDSCRVRLHFSRFSASPRFLDHKENLITPQDNERSSEGNLTRLFRLLSKVQLSKVSLFLLKVYVFTHLVLTLYEALIRQLERIGVAPF